MDIKAILDSLIGQFSWGAILAVVLQVLGSLMVLGQILVVVTPSKKDDELVAGLQKGIVGKIIEVLVKFAVVQKK